MVSARVTDLSDLRNMRVLLEEARTLSRDLAYHRRVRLEAALEPALDEVDRQIEDLRKDGSEDRRSQTAKERRADVP